MTSDTSKADMPRIAIAGAGIVGSAIASAMACRGADVTVIDEGYPTARATNGSFAWINAHSPRDPHYLALRVESIRLWREAASAIPDLPVRFGGTLNWEDPPERLAVIAAALDKGGNQARLVSRAEIARMEPALADPPETAISAPMEGAADPRSVAQAFLSAAEAEGAQVMPDTEILGVAVEAGRAIGFETESGIISADHTVLATGIAIAELLAPLDIQLPMDVQPGLLIRTEPVPPLTQRVLTTPDLHVWQMDDGRLLLGEDFQGGDAEQDPDRAEARLLARVRAMFTGEEKPVAEARTITRRPMPEDGYPAVGAVPGVPGLSIGVMHSGVTLAPVVAEALSREILEGVEVEALAPYRLGRFSGAG